MRDESKKFVLPSGHQPGGSKSSRESAPFKPLDSTDGTAFSQYEVEQLYHCNLVTLLLSQPDLGLVMVDFLKLFDYGHKKLKYRIRRW
jgi:hypothetical protein